MKFLQKTGAFVLCLLLAALALPAAAENTKGETIRVGWYEDSYHITGGSGARSGYAYEYEQAVAGYTGWNYEYVKGDWADLLEMLEKGEIDLMAAISRTEEREGTMLFSEQSMGEEKYYLYGDLAHTDISPSDLNTLNGKRVVVMEKSIQGNQFAAWEQLHGIHTRHMDLDSFEQALEMASRQELDCVVSAETPAWPEAGMSAVARIGGSDIYFGINKDRPDLKEQLDSAMRAIEKDNPFYADELHKRYLSSQSVAVLTVPEKKWLSGHGAIRMGWVKNDLGVSMIDPVTGELQGILCDYVAYAAGCLSNQPLTFDLTGFETQEEALEALKNGQIDAIFHVSQNPYEAERNGLALSETAWTIQLAAVTAQNQFQEGKANRVAVGEGGLVAKWFLSYNYPQWEILEYPSTEKAIRAVRSGEADCFISGSGRAGKYLKNSRLRSVALMQNGQNCFAVNRGDTQLLSILNKTLRTMPVAMLSGGLSMYENAAQKVTLTDFIRDNVLLVTAALFCLFLLILCIILGLLKRSRAAETKAKEAMAQAESANAAKSTFLFNMSHDIRTPMNAILGFAKLAEKNPDDLEAVKGYLQKIQVSGQGMLSILDNVLELSRIESGKTTLEETPQVAGTVFDACKVMMNPEIEKKHHTVTVEKHVQYPYVYFDATRVTEIILNILSNAIKYTADGGKIQCVLSQSPHPEKGWVYQNMTVTDNGIGMSEEFQEHVFEVFARERSSTVSGIQGTGLGMGIVKKLIELMGGTIEVKSRLGEGTTVSVRLPLRIASFEDTQVKPSTSVPGKERLRGKKILLAEDNDLNAEIATALLKDEGMIIDRVSNGVQCVEKLERSQAGTYDLILMDIQMPYLDGYQATQKIRKLQDTGRAQIPIIAMTANAFSEDRVRALDAGMNDHVAKPIDMNVVVKTLLKYL